MHVGIAGEVRCVVTKADGTVETDTGFQKNLILNQGLDFFGGGKGSFINATCAIGSGNSTPVTTQTKLDTFIALTSGTDTTSDYSYVDKGDNLYRIWEQKKYRFTNLDNANISEIGLVSTGSVASNYYLTTRVLIKDSSGAPTSISVKQGETLDVYYKIHKVIDTRDKNFVINVLDGSGGSIPYNVIIRPAMVGSNSNNDLTSPINLDSRASLFYGSGDLGDITAKPATSSSLSGVFATESYSSGYKLKATASLALNDANASIRSLSVYSASYPSKIAFPLQMRLGRVSDDAPLTKTNKDTLTIPLEFSWGRFEGEL